MTWAQEGFQRLVRVLSYGDPEIGLESWVHGLGLASVMAVTREWLTQELADVNTRRRAAGLRQVNVGLYLDVFDGLSEGCRGVQIAQHHHCTKERVYEIAKELREYESIKRLKPLLQERIVERRVLRELSRGYVAWQGRISSAAHRRTEDTDMRFVELEGASARECRRAVWPAY